MTFVQRACFLALVVVTWGTACSLYAQSDVYSSRAKPRGARVTILATSSSVHQGYAGNHDVYVANVLFRKDGTIILALLVDRYPGYGDPIRKSVLRNHQSLRMVLSREERCDALARAVYLAPDNENVFDYSLRSTMQEHASDLLPCFAINHTATRLTK